MKKNKINKERIYDSMLDTINYAKVNTSDIVNNLTSTDTNKPLSANQGKVLNDTTAKLEVSNVFTQPQQVPNATLPQHTTNKLQVETMFEMFKRELRGYNLAIPDLEGKEYLGNGVYRLYDSDGITFNYNVYNGEYTINGTTTNSNGYAITDYIFEQSDYVLTFYGITGSKSDGNVALSLFSPDGNPTNSPIIYLPNASSGLITDVLNYTVYGDLRKLNLYTPANITYNNYTFKVQIEKGDTATPYTVPGQIPQYKIVGEE